MAIAFLDFSEDFNGNHVKTAPKMMTVLLSAVSLLCLRHCLDSRFCYDFSLLGPNDYNRFCCVSASDFQNETFN